MQFMLSRHTLTSFQPGDDIDKLFDRLLQIEPPGELISRILSHVGHLTTPSVPPVQPDTVTNDELGDPIVRNERREPS